MMRFYFTGFAPRVGSFFLGTLLVLGGPRPAPAAAPDALVPFGIPGRPDPPAVLVRLAPGARPNAPLAAFGRGGAAVRPQAADVTSPWSAVLAAETPFEEFGLGPDEPLGRTLRLVLRPGADPAAVAAALAREPGTEAAWVEGRFRVAWAGGVLGADLAPDDPLYLDGSQWGLRNDGSGPFGGVAGTDIRAEAGWAVTTGSTTIPIAIVDTGIDVGHPDLGGTLAGGLPRIIRAFNASIEGGTASPADSVGHGTMVAGVALARTNNGAQLDGRGVAGVAGGAGGDSAGCRVIAVKATPTRLIDALSTELAKGIIYAVSNGARAINLSFGGDDDDDTVRDALSYAARFGCVVVCGAGNGLDARPQYPGYYARYGNGVSVAALGPDGLLAGFSSRGPQIDVAAPGVSIYSTYPTYENAYGSPLRNFLYTSGTSFAAPFVTGLAGLTTALQPSLLDNEFQQLLRHTARDVGAPGRDDTFGWGVPDAGVLLSFVAPPRGFLRGSATAQTWTLLGTDSVTIRETRIAVGGCGVDGRYLAERWEVRARVDLPPGRMLETPLGMVRTHASRGWSYGPLLEYDLGWGEVVPGTSGPDGFTLRTYVYRIPVPPENCGGGSPTPIDFLPVRPQDVVFAWSAFGRLDAPPTLAITNPTADGAPWPVDTPDTLRWEASDPDEVSGFQIEVSRDGGASWRFLTNSLGLAGDVRTFPFAAPCASAGATTLVRVTAYDTHGALADEASATSEIVPQRLCLPGEVPVGTGSFAMLPVAPNPAHGTATFRYERDFAGGPVARRGDSVQSDIGDPSEDLMVYDAAGRHLRTLQLPGAEQLFVVWDGRDAAGRRVPNGVYFARLRADGKDATQRFVFLAE